MKGVAHLLSAIVLWLSFVPLATAAEPPVLFRFYYSNWVSGTIDQSPADPSGAYHGRKVSPAPYGTLEVILFHHLGLSYSRQTVRRAYQAGSAQTVEETFQQDTYNATLYPFASRHNGFNLFLGGGAGMADYRYKINGIRQEDPSYHKGIPIQRGFAGLEYTFERLGIRLEYLKVRGRNKVDGSLAKLEQSFGYITLYIPLN